MESGSFGAPMSYRMVTMAQSAYEVPVHVFKNTHDSHPSLGHLCLLVFEAVLEVICVCLPGYIVARLGHFDAEKQKFLANLNVMLFTPCLIFTKLASQLNADKLADLAIIPAIFIVQTAISWLVSIAVGKVCGFNRRASNFVTAMGVFGNSNSLPISLVLSLSQTIKGLHWDRIPGDTDEEVGARGILYLLIFQQLGQLVRWSWGYHVLLASKDKYPEYQQEIAEEGQRRQVEAHAEHEARPLIEGLDGETEDDDETFSTDSRSYEPAGRTPVGHASRASLADMSDDGNTSPSKKGLPKTFPANNHSQTTLYGNDSDILSFPRIRNEDEDSSHEGLKGRWAHAKLSTKKKFAAWKKSSAESCERLYQGLPKPIQAILSSLKVFLRKFNNFLWEFMNPPLWAMLIAVLVASVPDLQELFFKDETFIKNSVTDAIKSSGGVAVPLILVVLGANLARNTQATGDESHDPEEEQIGTKLLVASLVSRMVLPTLIMAPILALVAKYVPISILDDPIFIIVCFLLSGAPSALQLAQICQINNVYEKTMGRLLFQSYVVWILPSTLILVMIALEVVEWSV